MIYFLFIGYYKREPISVVGVLSALGIVFPRNPACGPMWFVRNLFFLLALAPAFFRILNNSKKLAYAFVALCFLVWIFSPFLLSSFGYNGYEIVFDQWFSICGLTFFVSGIALRMYGIPRISRTAAVLSLLIGVVCSWLITANMNGWLPIEFLYRFLRVAEPILLLVGCYGLVPGTSCPSILCRNCFAVYAFHMLIILTMRAFLSFLGFDDFAYTFTGAVLFVLIPICVCLGFAEVLRGNCPKLAQILLGGR